jgi:argininosuccinate lyase
MEKPLHTLRSRNDSVWNLWQLIVMHALEHIKCLILFYCSGVMELKIVKDVVEEDL